MVSGDRPLVCGCPIFCIRAVARLFGERKKFSKERIRKTAIAELVLQMGEKYKFGFGRPPLSVRLSDFLYKGGRPTFLVGRKIQ